MTGAITRNWQLLRTALGLGWRAAPKLVVAALICSTVGAVASVLYTLGFRVIVDAAIGQHHTKLLLGVGLVAVLFTLSWSLGTIGASVNSVLTDRVALDLSEQLGRLVGGLPQLTLLESPWALRRIEQLRAQRRGLAGAARQLLGLWQVGLRSLGIMILLATVYLPVLIVPVFALAPALADRRANRVQSAADDDLADPRRLHDDLFALICDPAAARELRTYGILAELGERHRAVGEEIRRGELRAALKGAAWEAVGWLVYAAAFVGAIVILVLRAANGHASPGGVVMAVSLMRRAQRIVDRGTDTAATLGTSFKAARQLQWLEQVAAAAQAGATAAPPDRIDGGIVLRNLSFAYGEGDRVLDAIDLTLPAGTVVALVGENGAGKSTLVKLLLGLYAPTGGAIEIGTTDLASIDPPAWRSRTTATFQDYLRPQFTLRDAVGLQRAHDDLAITQAIGAAGATGLPALDAQLGRFFGGRELSGGQWQRVALARGLMRPDALLHVLDEPTANVDAPTERAIFERYARLARDTSSSGAITLIVTHRFATARAADLIVHLERGTVTETGTHDQLMAANGSYAELYALQAGGYT